jgi:hypothetical protein
MGPSTLEEGALFTTLGDCGTVADGVTTGIGLVGIGVVGATLPGALLVPMGSVGSGFVA